jgi:type I restriction enzyme R subunit
MAKITENDIELYAIEELENLGYSYIYGPDIAPDTDAQERTSFDQVILTERLQKQ